MERYEVGVLVIGAGVVGLAVARALALKYQGTGTDVWLVERHARHGMETSSRNSEVIHAGIYYPQGSLKAALCVKGKEALYEFCESKKVPYKRCGKLVVAATSEQADRLQAIRLNALHNGVDDLKLLSQTELTAMEPALKGCAALFSPSTGIVDSHAYMDQLLSDFELFGGQFFANTALRYIGNAKHGIEWEIEGVGARVICGVGVNCAGLHAVQLVENCEIDLPAMSYAKGDYFSYSGHMPFNRLIYPVPEEGGLGIHLTLDMGRAARFGPDVTWLNRSLAPSDFCYHVSEQKKQAFASAVSSYWPDVDAQALHADYAGIRPKLSGPGEKTADFMVHGPREHGVAGLYNLFGIESPGLTASLAIAEHVLDAMV